MDGHKPMVSLVCPVFNEAEHIDGLIKALLDMWPAEKEILFIDGGSEDGTREILRSWENKNAGIGYFDNPEKYVSFALNKAIPLCKAEVIIRIDAHTSYDVNYISAIMHAFDTSSADIVGGPMRGRGRSDFENAVGHCTATAFGIGNSRFHDETYSGEADSVYLGAWKKELFRDVGYFDTELIRNQDDEFHYRARSNGKKIYLDSNIVSWYLPRGSFGSLFKQYFQYGYYKPLVHQKVPSGFQWRHLIPSIFVLYLISLPLLSILGFGYALPGLFYLAADLWSAFHSKRNLRIKALSAIVYPTIHFSYGMGYLVGIIRRR